MKSTSISEQKELLSFAEKAREDFTKYPQHTSFSEGNINAGCLFAVRWGITDKAVLVFKLSEDFEPIVFG